MAANRVMPRFNQRLNVLINVFDKLWHNGSTIDFGPNGMCITCADVPGAASDLQLKVVLPDARVLRMMAAPVWTVTDRRPFGTREKRKLGLKITSAPESWYRYCRALDERRRVCGEATQQQPSLP